MNIHKTFEIRRIRKEEEKMPTFNYSIFMMMKNVANDSVIK